MTSFIIISKDKDKRLEHVRKICTSQKIHAFDITVIERETATKQNAQSIGIEEVKKIQKKLFLKPIKSIHKAVIIEEAHLLTLEAQNALLKVLEEPPANTLIFLTADNKEALLPTIHSRCQLVQLEETCDEIGEEDCDEIIQFLEHLNAMQIGERLKIAEQKAKEKEKALTWVKEVILVQRTLLLTNPDLQEGIRTLRIFQNLYTILKTTNVNPRMSLEYTLLHV